MTSEINLYNQRMNYYLQKMRLIEKMRVKKKELQEKETNNTFCGVAEALPISRNRRNQCNRCNPNNWSKEDLEKLRNATNNKI